jgi:hypothetical protein
MSGGPDDGYDLFALHRAFIQMSRTWKWPAAGFVDTKIRS